VNITKFYEDKRRKFNNFLFMDWYAFKSFDIYYKSNIKSLSLLTKIYLLCQVIQGLRFIRNNKIAHMDIKPQNIIIGKSLLLRVSDFG
jgi:serine/threonine protein kinase